MGRRDNILPDNQGAWISLGIKALIAFLTALVG